MLNRIACLFSRHKVNRHRVWHDGVDFRSRCAHCDKPMVRTEEGWQAYNETSHADDRRAPNRQAVV